MTDIVERLRGLADLFEAGDAPRHVVLHMRAGADEIERLRFEISDKHNSVVFLRSEITTLTEAFGIQNAEVTRLRAGGPHMIRADMIPDDVVEAAAIVLMGRLMVSHQDALHVWSGMYEPEKDQFRREARASIAAALNAWPWKFTAESIKMPHIVLPLPDKEVSDE